MSTVTQHSAIPLGHMHRVVNWEFATFDEMVNYTGVTAQDIHKFAYVTENAFKGYYSITALDVGTGAVTWSAVGTSGGVAPTAFTALTDTPSSYAGAASYKVVVNAGATGLVFVPDTGGGGGGATNLGYTASPTNGVVTSDTGTNATITLVNGTNAGLMAPAQHTKLTDIAANATANSTDAVLLARANHTGTQLASTISDLTEVTQDMLSTFLVAGSNVTITYNDPSNTLTIAAAGGSTDLSYTPSASNGIVVSSTGADATLPLADGTNAGLMAPAQYTTVAGIPSDLAEYVRDLVASFLVGGTNISVTHDDPGNTLTISRVGSQDFSTISNFAEGVQDTMGFGGLTAGTNISLTYDDPANTIIINAVLPADLVAIDALGGTSGLLRKTGTDTWSLDTSTFLTANQTITLSGDVTGSGTTAISATIPNDTVTFAKIQNIATAKLLGRGTAGTGDVEEITLGTNLSLTGTTLNASSSSSVEIAKNGGSTVGTRPRINFIEGSNVTLTVADDAGNNEVDVTIAASGGGGGVPYGESYVGYTDCANTSTDLAPFLAFGHSNGTISQVASLPLLVNHPGIVALNAGGNSNSGYRVMSLDMALDGGERLDCLFMLPANPTGGATRNCRLGWTTASNPAVGLANGACIKIVDLAVVAEAATSGTRTEHGTGYTLSVDTWYQGIVTIATDGLSCRFQLLLNDGTSVWDVTISSNVPAKASSSAIPTGFGTVNTTGGAGVLAYVDIMRLSIPTSVSRGNFT